MKPVLTEPQVSECRYTEIKMFGRPIGHRDETILSVFGFFCLARETSSCLLQDLFEPQLLKADRHPQQVANDMMSMHAHFGRCENNKYRAFDFKQHMSFWEKLKEN